LIDGRRVLGLITARGGSKGLPGKNVRELCGHPLIGWTVAAGLGARSLDDLVVSTDSPEIAAVAERYGATAPFLRPEELAGDTASSMDVVAHAIGWLRDQGRSYDYLMLLEPTSPLRDAADIEAALRRLLDSGATSIVGVCRADAVHPAFMYRVGDGDRLRPFMPQTKMDALRRQDTEAVYYLEGSVYASRLPDLFERGGFNHGDTIGYEVPKWKAPEIDDIVDFMLVEAIIRHRKIAPPSARRAASNA
jgi:N-acylneuraminate cytidylyltransferase/CMP-N,N'-diacetyllegionaminic acid synthase